MFLVALSSLGLTAVATNQVYAQENLSSNITLVFEGQTGQSADQDWYYFLYGKSGDIWGDTGTNIQKLTSTLTLDNGIFKYQGRTLDPVATANQQDGDYEIELHNITLVFEGQTGQEADQDWYYFLYGKSGDIWGDTGTNIQKLTSTLTLDNGIFKYQGRTLDPIATANQQDGDYEIGFYTESALEDLRPAISGQETFATKVDEARPVEYFIGFLKAIDDIDGDISDDIYIVTDNYTPNKSVLGTHAVTVGVEDSSGNVSEFTFKVSVVDIDAPIINGNATAVSIGYKETYNIVNFKSTLTVSDNYDTLSASDITIKSDNYTTNKTKLGTWNVIFEVEDSSGNTSTFTKTIKVIDNVAPVFSGIETLTKSYTEVMTLSEIIAQVTANDEIDGNLTNKITVANDGFTGKSNKVGTHYIELSVSDNAGNTTTRTITVKVIDDQLPGWFITNGVSINLTPGTELTRTQIVELLHKSGQVLAPANARITYLTDTYSDNIGTPGTYTLAFRTVLTNGQENTYTYAVNVLDDKTDEDTEVLPELPFYEKNKILIWSIGGAGLVAAAYFVFKKKKK